MIRAILLSLAASSVSAFAPRQMLARQQTLQRAQVLNDMDVMCIENAASFCSQEDAECDLDQEQALINRLESQAHSLEVRLDEMRSLAFALSGRPLTPLSEPNHQYAGPVLDEMDTMILMNTAAYCAEEGCDLEHNDALVNRLEEQSTAWNLRLMEVLSALKQVTAHHIMSDYMSLDRSEIGSLMHSIEGALARDHERKDIRVPVDSYE
mmetsp:Transcript_63057/g.176362  ORF Transcript_63057/g.176362 Transcript_63057/m.176362 type:complete len:209 (+) Transcript_63057:128-754(+)